MVYLVLGLAGWLLIITVQRAIQTVTAVMWLCVVCSKCLCLTPVCEILSLLHGR